MKSKDSSFFFPPFGLKLWKEDKNWKRKEEIKEEERERIKELELRLFLTTH